MFNILSFLQGGWPIFEKGGIEKSLENYVIRRKGYLKHLLSVHMSVSIFLYVSKNF